MRMSGDCFANFVTDVSHDIRVCCENFLVSRTGREVFKHVEKFYSNFFSEIFRKTVMRRSRDSLASVANLSPQNFGEFTMRNFRDTRTHVARVSHDGRATVLQKPRDYLAGK